MMRAYDPYWGKADPAVGGFHLAAFHALDVAAVAHRRIERSGVLRARLAALLALPEGHVAPTVAAWVALHDIGKLDVRFQLKARATAIDLDPRRATCRFRGSYDHGGWGYQQLRTELNTEAREILGADIDPILQAVTGHHGELPSRARRREDEDADAFRDWDRAARAEFLRDAAAVFAARGALLPCGAAAPSSPAVALVAGLCSISDWIGSQVEYFPYVPCPGPLGDYLERALAQADQALDALRLDAPASNRRFGELFPCTPTPRDVQSLTESLEVTAEPRLVVVEAQMGAGKTEAALSLAARLLGAGAASGLFFALPTMATSNGLFARVEEVVARMFHGDVNLLLAHSRARRSEAMRRLVERGITPRDGRYGGDPSPSDEEASAACAKWYLSSKRALVSQVGVGTIDQAMVAALRVRHHFVRLYGLCQSVVVLDEIHAYDAYMSVVLERLLEWLGALRAPVILLSATLPAERRQGFEVAYARGAFGTAATGPAAPEDSAYPLVSVVERAGRTTRQLPAPAPGYELAVELLGTADPIADLLPRLARESRHGRVAWIRNTVSEAQGAWDAARKAGAEPLLFHSRMRAKDRARVEEAVLKGFGRGGDREAGLVIATQVIEQSLDLDFDLMVSDLAPVDLLLQRAGRLHRHLDGPKARPRPAGFDRRLVIITPPAADVSALRFGPSRYVYDPATLWLAYDLLSTRPRVAVPGDVRELVEATYDSRRRADRLARAVNAAPLAEAERKREERRQGSEAHAAGCAIPPADFDPSRLRTAEDDDDIVQALTRESASVTLLPVLWDEARDEAATLDGVPLVLDPQSSSAWSEAERLQDEQIAVPVYRAQAEATARGEARAYEEWKERAHEFARSMHLGRLLIVPMSSSNAEFSGFVLASAGRVRVRYSTERGLWFP